MTSLKKKKKKIIGNYNTISYESQIEYYDWYITNHNYIDVKNKILRKGSISAQKGERVTIPINMAEGCILGIGKGNKKYNYSAPHGAGRLMSRAKARENIKLDDFKKSMEGIYTTCVCENTIDESPFAYKKLKDILPMLEPTVKVLNIVKPIYNFKAID